MEPRFEEIAAFSAVGQSRQFTPETMDKIGDLWMEFVQKIESIPHRKGDHCYGISFDKEFKSEKPRMMYLACAEVQTEVEVPEGMTRRDVPAAKYAVWTFNEHISKFDEFVHKVWGEYLPAADLKPADGYDMERYDERFDPDTGTGPVDYYIPIAKP